MDVVALRRGSVGRRLDRVRELRAKRRAKLLEQNEVAARLDALLGALQTSSKRVLKSVGVAISLSRRPGYIDYATHDDGCSDVTRLRELVDEVGRVGAEIAALDEDIARAEAANRKCAEKGDAVKPSSIAEWLERNGRPRGQQKNMQSQFRPSRRFVPHHGIGADGRPTDRAAQERSSAVTMVRGRMLA